MISAKDNVSHIAESLTEIEADSLLTLLMTLPNIITELDNIHKVLHHHEEWNAMYNCRSIIVALKPCSKLLSEEQS